ncbi:MAG TPA: TonB-dependent receptor, partial [Nitratifractor sp.]|nr:TonB-dependent receptor [Nitratifractor sp.]
MKKVTLSIFAAGVLLSPLFGAEDLGEVIVTSSAKVPQKIKETSQNVTVVTAEDIKERGAQSITDVLKELGGFAVASNGGAGQPTSVFVRGLSSDNLLVLMDGVPLTDYTQPAAAAALEHINLDSVERIEIVKGGQSGIWGASAAAGTINIITKGGAKDSASISLSGGSHSTKGAGVDYSKAFSKGGIAFGAHWLDTDGISGLAGENAEKDGYKNIDYYLKGRVNIDKNNQLALMARGDEGEFDFDSGDA